MKVTISVPGRFHAFYLAREMQLRGHLRALLTTYPRMEVAKYDIDPKLVKPKLAIEVVRRIWPRLPWNAGPVPDRRLLNFYDWEVSRSIPADTELFVGWSGASLAAIRAAKARGMTTLLVRGSTHALHQRDILLEEAAIWGTPTPAFDDALIEKQLIEYDETDFIYNQTEYVRRTFEDRGIDPARIAVVPTGVNPDWFYPIEKEDDVFRVIFCGGLSVRKGVPYLLQAFSDLDLPNSELWLIGPQTGDTETILKMIDNDKIKVKGVYREWDLYKAYSQGSVFCLPSIEEGLAMVQAQAMACGLPLICTEAAGGQAFVRDGQEGYIVPMRSAEAIAEKIAFCYENPAAAREMGKQARERVTGNFAWSHYGDRMEAAYRSLLDRSL